jgi:hypothetical protein
MEMAQIPNSKRSFNAAMRRQGDEVRVPDEVLAKAENLPGAKEFNEGIRASAEVVANVDKGFTHFVKRFRNDQEVIAAIQVEQGRHGEYGRGAYFEQGRHRCILAGTVANRRKGEALEDMVWTVCAASANSEPVLGQTEVHQENLWVSDEVAGALYDWDSLGDLSCTKGYERATQYQKEQMGRFSAGIRKFGQALSCNPATDGESGRAMGYAQQAAASRRFRVSDGPELWSQGQVVFSPPQSGTFQWGDEFSDGQERPEQNQAFPRRTGTGTVFSPFLEDSS